MASTLLTGLGLSAPAWAQEPLEEPAAPTRDEASDIRDQEDVVVVTGTRIRSANLVAVSPVTQIDAQEIADRGILRVEDMINTLPQAFAAQGSNISNGASGTATVNLRGLGSVRTLVLQNGRRLPFGSPIVGAQAADLNQIPGQLIERVEVLTGGASAVYGSDAVSGVVNFIMVDDFEGLELDAQYSFYQHHNDHSIQSLIEEFNAANPDQFRLPDENVVDGEAVQLSGVLGVNTPDGRGNATAYITYREVNPVYQANRDYSACAFGTRNSGTEFTCSGSSTNAVANFLNLGPTRPGTGLWFRTDGSEFIPRDFVTDTFNFNPFNFYQRPDERYTFGTFAHYEFNPHFDVYTELGFTDTVTNAQIAPSGVFGGGVAGQSGGIRCSNPFLTAQQVDFLCTQNGLSGDDVAEGVLILRRNVEGGPRQNLIENTTYRGVVGTRGAFFDTGFDYDVFGSYARVIYASRYQNELSIRKSSLALDAALAPDGSIQCRVNVDADPANDAPSCVPYNIFSGTPSAESLNYITSPLQEQGSTTQQVISGSIFGDLARYGIQSPAADTPVSIALGAEYRRDTLERNPDEAYQSGDGFGQGGATLPVSGSTDVWELFGEVQVPLVENRPGIEFLNFEGAYRFSEYNTGTSTDTYKAGLEWGPTSDLRIRAAYQRAVRAPNVVELFSPQVLGLFDLSSGPNGLFDPCAGDFDPATSQPAPRGTLAQCQNTGVTPAQYGNIADNPAGQFNTLGGGEAGLAPEVSDTVTIGVVLTPSMLPGFTLSVDYFDITVEDAISTIPESATLENCLLTGDPLFCSLINRGAGGTLWANPSGFITALNQNIGELSTQGVDIVASYTFDLADVGSELGEVNFELVGTYLESLAGVPFPGADEFDCVGFYGGSCNSTFGASNPEWRHKLRATWITPWNFDVTGTWRYFGEVNNFPADTPVHEVLSDRNWFDISGSWSPRDDLRFRAGVNNVFDEAPPLSAAVGAGAGNGNTFPQVYDALGRFVFFGVNKSF
ncbi:TonB-dependent receptor [Marinicauda algicola]|uniref:TonB-dependent receptor n=2 Tax=Marinicauda algicola TaxID=2029849 RepID=A0A4S2GWK4_9PROT|nr:TonB-dependent receptor [Marinicauda algicola]